jgi:ABC-2 type transport system permease protein
VPVVLAAMRFQLLHLRRSFDDLMVLVTLPLFTIAFLAITADAGRHDLAPIAVVGSSVIAIWSFATFVSGEVVDNDRASGALEALMAVPAPYALQVIGRIAAVTFISFLGLVESALAAWVFFDVRVQVMHPWVFAGTLLCTAFAMVGTASIMAGIFVVARSARAFQNSMSYPFYVLSGAVVPVYVLPDWIQPLSKMVFLSWSADLLRACLQAAPIADAALRLGVIAVLGAASLAFGQWLIARVLRRVRQTGAVSFA